MGQYKLSAGRRDADHAFSFCAAGARFYSGEDARGAERARAQGRKFGPKFKLNEEQIAHARDLQREGRGMREIGKLLGCNASTVSRALQLQQQDEEETSA